jgi:hypothetical protein
MNRICLLPIALYVTANFVNESLVAGFAELVVAPKSNTQEYVPVDAADFAHVIVGMKLNLLPIKH